MSEADKKLVARAQSGSWNELLELERQAQSPEAYNTIHGLLVRRFRADEESTFEP